MISLVGRPRARRLLIAAGALGIVVGAVRCWPRLRGSSAERRRRGDAERLLGNERLAMVAHELRTPLGAIRHAAATLDAAGDSGPHVRAASAIILRQIERLGRLVDDLLVPASGGGGGPEPRFAPVDLVTVLTETVEALRGLVEERGLQLVLGSPAGPLVLRGDRDGLAQIVTNLVWNAAKFTPAGGRISVTLAREGDEAVVRVRDNGIGIAPAMRGRIFRLFTRAAAPGDHGRGIGLTIVELITLRHGGRVSVHSDGPGCGSEFEVRLPRAAGGTGGGTTGALPRTCAR